MSKISSKFQVSSSKVAPGVKFFATHLRSKTCALKLAAAGGGI